MDDDRRRDPRPAGARHPHGGERRDAPARQYLGHDLRHRRAGVVLVARGPVARRHDHDGHALWRGAGAAGARALLPEAGRRGRGDDRAHRHAAQQGGGRLSASGPAKLVYRAERHPGFDREGFRARWRRHAALGMGQERWTNILRYAHCDPLDAGAPWDGVALLWYRDEAARLAHVADADARATMRADEAQTFARPVREFSTLVEEVRISGDGHAPLRHFVFLWRAPGLDRA
ncbi:MAG: hypothetical protein FJX69_20265, partial [Alphaproteobacteria bacterium]|nr:hypothetical protein [Alphaproteobacteria bacterium]